MVLSEANRLTRGRPTGGRAIAYTRRNRETAGRRDSINHIIIILKINVFLLSLYNKKINK